MEATFTVVVAVVGFSFSTETGGEGEILLEEPRRGVFDDESSLGGSRLRFEALPAPRRFTDLLLLRRRCLPLLVRPRRLALFVS